MPERTLKNGVTVKTRIVPTHAIVQVGSQFKRPIAPKVAIKSVAGHSELVTAPDDSPEWLAYVVESAEYDAKVERAKNDFIYDYAVEAWRNGTGEWRTEPPDDWTFPKIFEQHGLKPSESRRADFIRYELLALNEDVGAVLNDALGTTEPITDQEVDAAIGGFPVSQERRTYTRGQAKRHKGR